MILPHGLPALIATYGNPLSFVDHKADWEAGILRTAALKTPLPYAYGPADVTQIRAHKLALDWFVEFLAKAAEFTPDRSRIAYGGIYCWRAKRSDPRQLSVHTWGLAIDLDPARNLMGHPWNPDTGLPGAVVELAETMGAVCGVRWQHPDSMHIQLAAGV